MCKVEMTSSTGSSATGASACGESDSAPGPVQDLLLRAFADGTLLDALEPHGITAAVLPPNILQVSVDPLVHASAYRCGLGAIYALSICSNYLPQARQNPQTLPEGIVGQITEALTERLADLPGLTAHDLIPLCEALTDGFNRAPPQVSANPARARITHRMSPPAACLLERAERAQKLLEPELASLEATYSRYRDSITGRALREPLQKLAHWSGFADYLAHGPHRDRCGNAKVLDLMAIPAATAFDFGRALSPHQAGTQLEFNDSVIDAVHRSLANVRVPQMYHGKLRAWATGEQRQQLSSCGSEADADGGLPDRATNKALLEHGNVFARDEWKAIHPVVAAAMAQADFMRIRPYWACNDLTARVLTEIRLAEAGWSGLPLALLLMKFWPARLASGKTVTTETDVGNIRQLARICKNAIRLGTDLIPVLLQVREQLMEQLFGSADQSVEITADAMLSNLCFRPGDLLTPEDESEELAAFLEPALRSGLLTVGPPGECRFWMAPALRSAITPIRRSPPRRC